jgi:hypothetical protein
VGSPLDDADTLDTTFESGTGIDSANGTGFPSGRPGDAATATDSGLQPQSRRLWYRFSTAPKMTWVWASACNVVTGSWTWRDS